MAKIVGAIKDIFWNMELRTTPNFLTVSAKRRKVTIKVKPIMMAGNNQSFSNTSSVTDGLPMTKDAIIAHTK
jgi:hypothetical protein